MTLAFGNHDPQTLTPRDFILCGFLKERVFSDNSRNLEDLKHNTEQAVAGRDQ
jgi:hypothetical protein